MSSDYSRGLANPKHPLTPEQASAYRKRTMQFVGDALLSLALQDTDRHMVARFLYLYIESPRILASSKSDSSTEQTIFYVEPP